MTWKLYRIEADLRPAPLRQTLKSSSSVPDFKDSIKWRFRGTAELSKAAGQHLLANRIFGSNRAERCSTERHRIGGAAKSRGAGECATNYVEVFLDRITCHGF